MSDDYMYEEPTEGIEAVIPKGATEIEPEVLSDFVPDVQAILDAQIAEAKAAGKEYQGRPSVKDLAVEK